MTDSVQGVKFGRNYSLEFFPINKADESIKIGQLNRLGNNKRYITGLAVEFSVTKTMPPMTMASTDKAEITIYNIEPNTSRAIQKPGMFIFSLGHGEDLTQVFSGKSTTTSSGISGNDTFLKLPMVSGSFMPKERYFKKEYNKGAVTSTMMKDLINFIKGKKFFPKTDVRQQGIDEYDRRDDKIYNHPVTMRGDAVRLLANLLAKKYYVFVTSMNTVNIVKKVLNSSDQKLILAGPALKWSPAYGQVDYIKFTSRPSLEDEKISYQGIESRGILTPEINLGTIMNVDASVSQPSVFGEVIRKNQTDGAVPEKFISRVLSVHHFGNTYTGEFLTNWEGDIISTNAKPQI